MLQADRLTYRYPGAEHNSLDNLSLTVPPGRRLALLGANGAGKTTLMLHLNGTLRPNSGRVLWEGVPQGYGRADLLRWRQRVALALQDADDQLFAATVAEDISFGPLNLGLSTEQVRQRVDEALQSLRLQDLAHRPPHLLSHGQRKRVAIAGLLAMHPQVMILDEPTAGLDYPGERDLLTALETLTAGGTTVVFATHDVELAYDWADEVALFIAGRTFAHGPARALLSDPALLAHASLKPLRHSA